LEMVNQIFSNDENSIQKRFEEYFIKKDSVRNDFKLIFEIIIQFISERTTEAETELLKEYLLKEEEIIKKVLVYFYKDKIKAVSKSLPYSIVMLSWMIAVGKKISLQLTSEKEFLTLEEFQNIIESILT
ncbi:MAG: hypothetical protein ACK4UV_06635, partial [Ignavibacterium sp.]